MRAVIDIETTKEVFTLTGLDIDTLERYQFVICKYRDDSSELRIWLDNLTLFIGFNSIDFDYPVVHYFLTETLPKRPRNRAMAIYREAQRLIDKGNKGEFTMVRNPLIPQMDLFRIHHYDNDARATSLKWLSINMGMENVQDMPIHHSEIVDPYHLPVLLEYNLNDVMVTYELYKRSQSKIKMREVLSEKYGVDMGNFPDTKIGEYIVLKKLSEKLKTSIPSLRQCRTYRPNLKLADVILPSINFQTPEFNKILDAFKTMVVRDTRKSDDLVAHFDGVDYYFGFGGIHGCRSNGVMTNVVSCDVTGFYPSLAVSQGFYPKQFGREFVDVYAEIARERSQFAKGTDENTALKLAQNGVFGKSNSEYSPFYDPFFFMQITINGQLLLAMLCERITTSGAGKVLMANTDGIEVQVSDKDKYLDICSRWERKFGLRLEHSTYKLLAIRDINNYIGIKPDGKIKLKGAFDYLDLELHKNHSMRIVPKAVVEYFKSGTLIDQIIRNEKDESLFLLGERAKTGGFKWRELRNGELFEEPLPKNIRYYVSTTGGAVFRVGTKGPTSQVQKGFVVTLVNKLKPLRNVNYRFYIKEAQKLLDSIIIK